MCFRHWIFAGVLVALGSVQALALDAYAVFVNQTSTNVLLYYYGANTCPANGYAGQRTMTPGESWTWPRSIGSPPATVAARGIWAGGVKDECHMFTASGQTHYFYYNGTSGAGPTNYYCYYHVVWRNDTLHYAEPGLRLWDGEDGYYIPDNLPEWTLTAIRPGASIDFWYTNNIGTNPVACLKLIYGDQTEGVPVSPDVEVDGTRVGVAQGGGGDTGPPDGGGNNAGSNTNAITGSTNNAWANNAGGSTNSASQSDIFKMSDTLVGALADMNRTLFSNMNKGFAMLSTNLVGGTGTNLAGVLGGKLDGMGTNLAAKLDGVGTNIANMGNSLDGLVGLLSTNPPGGTGLGSNQFDAISSNLFIIRTNTGITASNLARMDRYIDSVTNTFGQEMSNAYFLSTNTAGLDDWTSNKVSVIWDALNPVKGYGNSIKQGFEDARSSVLALGGHPIPSDFLVLAVKGLDGEDIFSWDLKPVIALEPFEDRLPGIRAWVKAVLFWGALVGLIVLYVEELRQALVEALSVVPDQNNAMAARLIGGAAGGPVGLLGVGVASTVMSAAKVLGWVTALVWLPSILVGVHMSLAAMIPEVADMASWPGAISTVVQGPPGHYLSYWVTLTAPWLPYVELFIMGLNAGVVFFGMNGTVMILLPYMVARRSIT